MSYLYSNTLSHSEFSARGGRSMSKVKRQALTINAAKARAARVRHRSMHFKFQGEVLCYHIAGEAPPEPCAWTEDFNQVTCPKCLEELKKFNAAGEFYRSFSLPKSELTATCLREPAIEIEAEVLP